MKKINSTIINAELNTIVNKKTGVAKEYTKVTYTVERENTKEFKGSALLKCWIPKNCIDSITQFIMKPVQMELDEIMNEKGCNYRISKINNNAI